MSTSPIRVRGSEGRSGELGSRNAQANAAPGEGWDTNPGSLAAPPRSRQALRAALPPERPNVLRDGGGRRLEPTSPKPGLAAFRFSYLISLALISLAAFDGSIDGG